MYLSHVKIKNYRLVPELAIEFHSEKNVILGKNNAGKSNVIKPVDLVLGEPTAAFLKILRVIFIVSGISLVYTTQAQTLKSEQDVYDADKVTFVGYDFSHFKLADPKRANQDIAKFIGEWIGFCQEHITEKKLTSWLDKKHIEFNFSPTLKRHKRVLSETLIAYTKHSISKDSLQYYVNQYDLPDNDGVGFVVILECFDKASKTTSAYFTFFDHDTKQILMTDYISSRDGNSYNRVLDWGTGIVAAFKKYVTVYKNRLKREISH